MAETQAEINESLTRMVNLSSTAKHVIETHSFHMSFPIDVLEDGNIEPVRQEAFVGLVEDMISIGLVFTCPNEEVYSDNRHILSEVLDVLEFLMPNGLYRKLQQFPKLIDGIQQLLHGIDDRPIVESYLAWLGGLDNRQGFMPSLQTGCQFLMENLRCEAIFVEYLENLIRLIQDERVLKTGILESVTEYQLFVNKIIHRAALIRGVLATNLFADNNEIEAALNIRLTVGLVRPFSDPMLHNTLVFLYLSHPESMSAENKAFYDKKWYEYKVGNKLFAEYYTVRTLPIMPMDVLGFCIYGYCTTDTAIELLPILEAISAKYPNYKDVMEPWFEALLTTKQQEENDK